MGKHKRFQSHTDATSTGPGASRKTAGHQQIGLLVVADGLDPSADTLDVRVEVSPNGDDFAPVKFAISGNSGTFNVGANDFAQSDSDNSIYTAFVQGHNIPVEHVRANIESFTDSSGSGLSVNSYIYLTGWAGDGKSYNERTDFA